MPPPERLKIMAYVQSVNVFIGDTEVEVDLHGSYGDLLPDWRLYSFKKDQPRRRLIGVEKWIMRDGKRRENLELAISEAVY